MRLISYSNFLPPENEVKSPLMMSSDAVNEVSDKINKKIIESKLDFSPVDYTNLQRKLLQRFHYLVITWKEETKFVSTIDSFLHSAYQEIIGMGEAAVPLILNDLEMEPAHWFWALRAITGENPVLSRDQGNISRMRASWLKWGKKKGY